MPLILTKFFLFYIYYLSISFCLVEFHWLSQYYKYDRISPNRYSSTYKPDKEPKVVGNLVNSKDGKLSNIQGIALCRCEAPKNKLFCDGSHFRLSLKEEKN